MINYLALAVCWLDLFLLRASLCYLRSLCIMRPPESAYPYDRNDDRRLFSASRDEWRIAWGGRRSNFDDAAMFNYGIFGLLRYDGDAW